MNKTEYKDGGNIIDFNPNHVPSKRIINYAKSIKQKHPKIWDLGGNIFGNEAFDNLERVSKRGYWLESEEWMYIKWRSYVARHQHDFRIEGVIAMLKWADIVNKGWSYMKDLIEAKIEKTTQMKQGGEIEQYKEQGILDLNFFPTNSKHAKEYGINAKNPLFIQNLTVKEIDSLKNLDEYAKNNGHDVIFGHIIQKAKYPKDKQKSFFSDVEMIKNWLHNNGYAINQDNNDFHKVLTDKQDSVTMDIPLLIRTLELAREDVKSDAELHHVVENLLKLKNKKVLTMDDYEYIANVKAKHISKMENGGNIIGSKYSDDFEKLMKAENYIVKYYDDNTDEVLPNEATIISLIKVEPYYELFSVKLPKKQIVTFEWVINKISSDKTYINFTNDFNKLLKQKGYNHLNCYPTSYGIGIFLIAKNTTETKKIIEELLNSIGVKYKTEYSDANYVFRFVISKSKENIEKMNNFDKQISIEKHDEIAEMNEAIETLNLLLETLPKEEHKEIAEAIEILKMLK